MASRKTVIQIDAGRPNAAPRCWPPRSTSGQAAELAAGFSALATRSVCGS